VVARFSCRKAVKTCPRSKPINPLPNPGGARIILETDVTVEFSFFAQPETVTVAIELRIAETDLWNQEAIESPGAAFDGAGQDRSFSVDRWWWKDGTCSSGRTHGCSENI